MQPTFDQHFYVDGNDRDILTEMNSRYQQDITLQQQWWVQADIDERFKAGDQSLWSQIYGSLPLSGQRQFNFNRIRRIINMLTGYQRKNRKSIIAVPQETEDQLTTDQLSKCLQWVLNNNNGHEVISDAFEGAITTGLNLISFWIDYRDDPVSGDIKMDRLDFNGFMIDPNFKRTDLTDAAYIWTRQFVTKQQAKILFPGREDDIDKIPYTHQRDGKFTFLPQNYQFQAMKVSALDWYWYQSTREVTFLKDDETGECMEWQGEEKDLDNFLESFPNIIPLKRQKPTAKVAVLLNGKVMYNGPNPWKIDRYPFVGTYCYFEPQIPYFWWKISGITRGLRDAQYLYNHRKRIELDILESQVNSGLKVKEDALVDIKDAFMTGQGRVLVVKKTASLEDVEQIPPPAFDVSSMQVSESLGNEMLEIAGISEELLGMADDDKAGILAMLRQGAALTTQQKIFDQLDFSMKEAGNVILEMIQSNFTKGKVKRILNQEPSERFEDKAFPKYNCVIEEGIYTSTQQQMQFSQMLYLKQAGVNIPDAA